MKILFLLPLSVFCFHVTAQNNNPAEYASMITASQLKKNLSVIASAEMEGRETGTAGQRKAAAYIEKQFKATGLKIPQGMKGYQQFYSLFKDSLISSKLEIAGSELVFGTDYISPVNTNKTGKFYSSEIAFAGYGIEDKSYNDYASIEVKGKTVILFLGEPKQDGKYLISGTDKTSEWTDSGLTKKMALAAKKGANAVLIINPAQGAFDQRMINKSKRSMAHLSLEKELNYAILSHPIAKNILGTGSDSLLMIAKYAKPFLTYFLSESALKISFDYIKYHSSIQASNVIGYIEGTDKKDEYVFLTAHYDHLGIRNGEIYYGADDDGSGTAAVLQMARAFVKAKKAGKGPRRSVVFMTFSGEENGLLGSEYYSDNAVYPLEKTSVNLNTDMVGRIDTERKTADTINYVYVVGHDKLSSDLAVINESINKKYTNLVLDYKFDDPEDINRIYFRSDHYHFARKNVPVLFFYDGMLKGDYHKPTDTIDKINWALFEKRTRLIFHTAWEMANRDEMLVRDIPLSEAAGRR